jgi:hypothetical protein
MAAPGNGGPSQACFKRWSSRGLGGHLWLIRPTRRRLSRFDRLDQDPARPMSWVRGEWPAIVDRAKWDRLLRGGCGVPLASSSAPCASTIAAIRSMSGSSSLGGGNVRLVAGWLISLWTVSIVVGMWRQDRQSFTSSWRVPACQWFLNSWRYLIPQATDDASAPHQVGRFGLGIEQLQADSFARPA